MLIIQTRQQAEAFDKERAGRKLKVFAIARQFISALSVDFDRRELRWHLLDIARELAKRGCDIRIAWAGLTCRDHFALGIIGIGGLPEADRENIGLHRIGDIGNGLCRLTKGNGQNTRRLRIKRACMARLIGVQGPFYLIHNSGRCRPSGFIHHQPPRDITTFFPACHMRFALYRKAVLLPARGVLVNHDPKDRSDRKAEIRAPQLRRIKPRDTTIQKQGIG